MNPLENDPQGGAGSATSPASPQGAPTSLDVEALAAALRDPRAASVIKELVVPAFQSDKDRRIAKQEQRLTEVESVLTRLQELKDEGFTEKQAIRIMKMEGSGQPSEVPAPQAAPTAVQATQPQAPRAEAADPAVFGLDPSDPVVTEYTRQGKTSVSDWYELAHSRRNRTTTPAPAAVLPSSGAAVPRADDDIETLTLRVNALMNKPGKSLDEIQQFRELSAQLKAKLKQP